MAPTAPIAPASVGVVRPSIIVPSTTKISTADGTMPIRHFFHSAQPVSVRASAGTAGTHSGRAMDSAKVYSANSAIWMTDGPQAPRYMSPTDLPSWSASTISTSDGGTSWVMVPEAASTPVV